MTELSFLLELILNHKLQKSTKDIIQARIVEIQARPAINAPQMAYTPQPFPPTAQARQATRPVDSRGQAQSPSMARAIAEMEAAKNGEVLPPEQHINREPSPEVVAAAMAPHDNVQNAPQLPAVNTQAAAQALRDRAALVNQTVNGKPPTQQTWASNSGGGTTSGPRKF